MCGGIPGARWTPQQNMHLTVRFIGEVSEPHLGDIDSALSAVHAPSFSLSLDGVGAFGEKKRPRVIWAGVEPSPALAHLHNKIESALVRAGLDPDTRKFTPHITLARLKSNKAPRVGDFIASRNPFHAGPFPVESFTLYSSFLSAAGAIHREEATYLLEAA